jgi:hypothetical protein
MGINRLLSRLLNGDIERRGEQYVLRYEDDTGIHERTFATKDEAKEFRAALGMAGMRGRPFGRGPVGSSDEKFTDGEKW